MSLNRLVAERVMGIQPRVSLQVSNDGGKSSAFGNESWENRHVDVAEWLAEKQAEGAMKDYRVVEWKHYPDFTGDISAAWEVVNHMKSKGHRISIGDMGGEFYITFVVDRVGVSHQDFATAICLAALAALGVSDDEVQEAMR